MYIILGKNAWYAHQKSIGALVRVRPEKKPKKVAKSSKQSREKRQSYLGREGRETRPSRRQPAGSTDCSRRFPGRPFLTWFLPGTDQFFTFFTSLLPEIIPFYRVWLRFHHFPTVKGLFSAEREMELIVGKKWAERSFLRALASYLGGETGSSSNFYCTITSTLFYVMEYSISDVLISKWPRKTLDFSAWTWSFVQ